MKKEKKKKNKKLCVCCVLVRCEWVFAVCVCVFWRPKKKLYYAAITASSRPLPHDGNSRNSPSPDASGLGLAQGFPPGLTRLPAWSPTAVLPGLDRA